MKPRFVRYVGYDAKPVLQLDDINKRSYQEKFRGKLFCPTEGCPARMVYSGGESPHFRKWKYDYHALDCPYYTEMTTLTTSPSRAEPVLVIPSWDRKQNALSEAYRLMIMTDEEREQEKERQSVRQASLPISNRQKKSPRPMQLTIFGEGIDERELVDGRRKNILKRHVEQIGESDIEQPRLIMGYVKHILIQPPVATIIVENKSEIINLVFEETFIKEPLNHSYLNKFWAIQKSLQAQERLIITCIGEVRRNRNTLEYELSVFYGTDLKINDQDLYILAAQNRNNRLD